MQSRKPGRGEMTTAKAAADFEEGWYAASLKAVPECRVLPSDLDVDVCVIGAGVASLTVAYDLAGRGWSVAVLGRGRIGEGGVGHGTGIVAPGFCETPQGIVRRVGEERARLLWNLSAEGVERVRVTIDRLGLDDASLRPGLLTVERSDREAAVRRRADLLRQSFATEAEFWPAAQTRQALRSTAWHQALHLPQAFHIHPLRYLTGLVEAARRAGARIYEHSPVRAIDAVGIRKQVDAVGGRVRARHIVLAAPGDLGALHPPLAGTVMSLAYPIGVTAPLGPALAEAMPFAGAAVSEPAAGSHRIVDGDRLLWTGALTTRQTPPRRLGDQTRRAILRVYPQLRTVGVEHAWYGRADYAVHRMPQIGELAPCLWLAAAFGHQGIAAGAMAGDLIARAIAEDDDRWRLFHSYGLVWAGGLAGRVSVGFALGLARLRERFGRHAAVQPKHAPEGGGSNAGGEEERTDPPDRPAEQSPNNSPAASETAQTPHEGEKPAEAPKASDARPKKRRAFKRRKKRATTAPPQQPAGSPD
jgi:gamma-glutamylputrescine oxidase